MRRVLMAACVSVALAGCATSEPAARWTTQMPSDMTPKDRQGYVALAAASDLFEVQSSQLALSRANSPAVRDFAQMLVTHHTQTTQQLRAAATAAGMIRTHDWMLPPHMQAMMDELQKAPSAEFDRIYVRQQIPAHQMAIALHRNYADRGDTPALRAVAMATVPIVQQHLARAEELD